MVEELLKFLDHHIKRLFRGFSANIQIDPNLKALSVISKNFFNSSFKKIAMMGFPILLSDGDAQAGV